jgi:hypothetical protein
MASIRHHSLHPAFNQKLEVLVRCILVLDVSLLPTESNFLELWLESHQPEMISLAKRLPATVKEPDPEVKQLYLAVLVKFYLSQ